ncbi:MAG TPA: TIGR01777 family oxidoreductase [Candidatus Nanopelagicaceae bacterium]|nr:TIGR01777 family oxidoreductase [Candidatus Nanopelagicaceae bacterium]
MRIAITGASGLIGSALVKALRKDRHKVQRLVRRDAVESDEVNWDPAARTIDLKALEGIDAIVHLAGAGVGDKRWSAAYREIILSSRVDGTETIALASQELRPQVLLSASAIGWYGETGNRAVTENDRAGDDFLAGVCRAWEAAADLAGDVRTVKLRTGLVLDPRGGALGRMIPLFRTGVGGRLGSGRQWWSWITLRDQIGALKHLLQSDLVGPVNMVAPNPSTNSEVTAALARVLHRPALLPVPAFALKLALGGFSTEVLGSKKVLPEALLADGFVFQDEHIVTALAKMLAPH